MERTKSVDLNGLTPAEAIKALKKLPKKSKLRDDADEGLLVVWDDGKKPPKYRPAKQTSPLTTAEIMERNMLFNVSEYPYSQTTNGLAYWINKGRAVHFDTDRRH
jgi:hypothetical protein